MKTEYKLYGKIFLQGQIEVLTGLTIGGSAEDVAIGGIDNNVIKTTEGTPYLPGSSLKGKIRSLLEKKEGKNICNCGEADCDICAIFGTGASRDIESGPTRFAVRDAHLSQETKDKMENKEGIFSDLELTYTESKWENTIDRQTSKARNPRQTERVPAGADFVFEMVFNIMCEEDLDRFQELIVGLRLLEDDYLGSSGSRGYGRIKFKELDIGLKTSSEYETTNEKISIFSGELDEFDYDDIKTALTEEIEW